MFFDVSVGGEPAGRIVIGLYGTDCMVQGINACWHELALQQLTWIDTAFSKSYTEKMDHGGGVSLQDIFMLDYTWYRKNLTSSGLENALPNNTSILLSFTTQT